MYLSSDDGLSGVYTMDKFLVKAYSQQAREVNGGTGERGYLEDLQSPIGA